MLKDYLIIAFGSMRKRFLRTSLTMLGIFIGIAAVVSLISLGQGMQAAINAQFASIGTDKIIIQGATAGFGPPGSNTAGIIDKHDLDIVKRTSGVKRAAGRLLRTVTGEFEGESDNILALSMPEEPEDRALAEEANNLRVEQGRMLKPDDRKKAVVGNNIWNSKKFSKKMTIGSKLLLNGEKFEIIGLMPKIATNVDMVVLINEDDAREIMNEDEQFSMIAAQVAPGEVPSRVADRISRAMRKDRHQKEGFEDFTIKTSEEVIKSVNTILGVVQAILVGIALISLLVGGIGIMNTMYTAVLERKKDIGIMKAIGARNRDVMLIFLLESGLLGMAGGAVGILIGMGLSKTVEIIATGIIGNLLKASFPWYLIVGALAFSFLVGMISGVLPARQASRLPPVEALRGEL
ncbi:MAG: ABC transporter permease [Candidatus Woesearchaeota archaeon]